MEPTARHPIRRGKNSTYKEWVIAGRPDSEDEPLKLKMKACKRNFRSEQRRSQASIDKKLYDSIMEAEKDPKLFFKLIKSQRSTSETKTNSLLADSEVYEGSRVMEGWATYQEALATPLENEKFHEDHKEIVDIDVQKIYEICLAKRHIPEPFTINEVTKAITALKTGKAADVHTIAAEHLKHGGSDLALFLHSIFNAMLKTAKYPELLKIGLINPIYKKGKNSIRNPDYYRKITIISTIGKLFEKLYILKVKPFILENQSPLQYGFTEGISPMIAAVMMTEAISHAKLQKKPLYIAFLDTKKAFDVVWHSSLLRKLYLLGIEGNLWLVAKEMYKNMKAQVKWDGLLSREITIKQGLNQGGVGSPNFWKTYENPLFLLLEQLGIGYNVGSIYMGEIILADDKAFLSSSPYDLQSAIDAASDYANSNRYINGIDKSEVVIFNKRLQDHNHKWTMNGQNMNTTEEYTHIGINRNDETVPVAEAVIKQGRRTTYALMGAGLHGVNGLNPRISYKLWTTYVLSSCTFGLEALQIKTKDLAQILKFERKTLKHIQTLPDNTADEAVYILLGALPIDYYIEKKKLTLFGAIIRREGTPEKELATRQLAMQPLRGNSWFQEIERITHKYKLPSTHRLISNPPSKPKWKMMIDHAVHKEATKQMIEGSKYKTSLKYLNIHAYEVGKAHPVWDTTETNTRDVERAAVKAQLLCGTYRLQAYRHKINQHEISTCPLCKVGADDITHFILKCSALAECREPHMIQLQQMFKGDGMLNTWLYITEYEDSTLQLILDASKYRWLIGETIARLVETISRKLCYDLHKLRSTLVAPGGLAFYQKKRSKKKPKPKPKVKPIRP
jgi:hypothetical protein